jgi:LysR family transcriptional regulator, transcription activator of glutamate synthase operon
VATLFTEELVVVVPPSHRLAERDSVAFAELADESFLLYPRGYGMRDNTLGACQQAGFTPRIVLDGGEMDMMLRLAEAGLGIALMPRLALDGSRKLVALRVSDQQLQRTMALVSREDRALAPAARALRAFLEEQLVREPAADEPARQSG